MTSGIGPVEESGPFDAFDPSEASGPREGAAPRQGAGPAREFSPVEGSRYPAPKSGRRIPRPNSPSPRARSRLLAVLALAAALTTTLLAVPLHDGRPTVPPPWPLSVTQLTYTGLREPPDPRTHSFTFRLRATLAAGPPTTLSHLAQPYDGLAMSISPTTPLTLRTGTPRTLTLHVAVRHCTGLPQGVELPFLNVTLRNMRGTQNPSYILGADYAQDLSSSLRAICM
ncbi:hypothetical protein AB5J56_33335 [Streptomyces sp. R21]|uniref:Tat pathway signal sequence domain protein n=1 Tax=Streptomyces sp. R21 TaxID=3238627 RepID=A0AB39PHJ1_9ACTN